MSIIGKPITAPTSGLKPEIVVTSTAGSTLTVTENGVTKASYTLGASETEHTFKGLSVGHTYTVTASDGTMSFSRDVYVDMVAQHPVIVYPGTLYWEGTDNSIYTGGWHSTTQSYNSSYTGRIPNVTLGEESFTVQSYNTSTGWFSGSYGTINKIDLTNYSSLNFIVSNPSSSNRQEAHAVVSETGYISVITELREFLATDGLHTIDCSSFDDEAFIGIDVTANKTAVGYITVSRIWLE